MYTAIIIPKPNGAGPSLSDLRDEGISRRREYRRSDLLFLQQELRADLSKTIVRLAA